MTHAFFNPPDLAPPFGPYSHAGIVEGQVRWLFVAGQVGVAADGVLAEGFEAQAEQVVVNLTVLLREAGMGWGDVVKLSAYITNPAHTAGWRAVRRRMLAGHAPCATLLVVAGLADPAWLIEAEIVAARPV